MKAHTTKLRIRSRSIESSVATVAKRWKPKTCSACHRLDEVGTAVGANLKAIRDRGKAEVLLNILEGMTQAIVLRQMPRSSFQAVPAPGPSGERHLCRLVLLSSVAVQALTSQHANR